MGLRVVGAGLGRTGTYSLKLALERLLGAPCYHMAEVFAHPEHVPDWDAAARGHMPDWDRLLAGYAAAVDWPASAFWREMSEAFPEALVVLSIRDPESWWHSTQETIFAHLDKVPSAEWRAMVEALFTARFTTAIHDHDACVAAFARHNAEVRATVAPERLLVWQASEGWEPLCAALGLPVQEEPFPRANTREEWAARHADAQKAAALQ